MIRLGGLWHGRATPAQVCALLVQWAKNDEQIGHAMTTVLRAVRTLAATSSAAERCTVVEQCVFLCVCVRFCLHCATAAARCCSLNAKLKPTAKRFVNRFARDLCGAFEWWRRRLAGWWWLENKCFSIDKRLCSKTFPSRIPST